MPYQTFPWQAGDSQSLNKLVSLYLPSLKGKSVLDVGCNLGFFCGYAAFHGASAVVGVDRNPNFIDQARSLFTQCTFSCQDWNSLGSEQYDVIIFLSALHYAADQKEMLDFLMARLKPDGLLVLELGIAPGENDCFVEVTRSIDKRYFPTRKKVCSMLKRYVYKSIGKSVQQRGDPTPRFVFHIQHKRPIAVLLMDDHYSGKSTLAKTIFNDSMVYFSGDSLYYKILSENIDAKQELRDAISQTNNDGTLNCTTATNEICKRGLGNELCHLIYEKVRGKDFLLDMYVPYEYRQEMCAYWDKAGFFVADIAMYGAHIRPYAANVVPSAKYQEYIEYLENDFLINEDEYLRANPDVAKAVEEGRMPSAQFHYWHFGRREKRKLKV